MSVQYRVVVGKKDERIDGPDDADIVITAPVEIARAAWFRRHRRVHARQGQGRRSQRPRARPLEVRRGDHVARRPGSSGVTAGYVPRIAVRSSR